MNYYHRTNAHGTNGVKTITCGFQPVKAKLTVTGLFSATPDLTTDSDNHKSVGTTDGTRQHCNTNYSDGSSNNITISDDTKMIRHIEEVSGVPTEVMTIALDSFTATAFKYNVIKFDANYNILIEIEG